MEKLYNKIDFVNNTTPALNATNLNRMSKGLDDLDNRVIDLAADIMEVGPAAEAAMEAAGTAAEAAETASGASETATEAATSAEGYASDAKNWAVGPSGTGTGTDTNNAKYWAEQAAGAVSGVSSFNGRSGAVTPQSGDYTASQVGALGNDGSNAASTVTLGGDLNVVGNYRKNGSVYLPGHMIVDSADNYMPQRGNLKFEGATVTDNSLDDETVITMSASGKADISAIGYNETGLTCSKSGGYTTGDNFYKDGKFCTAIATINQGATFTENTNYVKGTIADAIKSLNSGLTNRDSLISNPIKLPQNSFMYTSTSDHITVNLLHDITDYDTVFVEIGNGGYGNTEPASYTASIFTKEAILYSFSKVNDWNGWLTATFIDIPNSTDLQSFSEQSAWMAVHFKCTSNPRIIKIVDYRKGVQWSDYSYVWRITGVKH